MPVAWSQMDGEAHMSRLASEILRNTLCISWPHVMPKSFNHISSVKSAEGFMSFSWKTITMAARTAHWKYTLDV